MDFFEAQARAKKHTTRLVVLFGLAVVGTILAAYVSGVLILRFSGDELASMVRDSWWQPRLFGWITAGTLVVVGGASFTKWRQFSAGGSVVADNLGGRRVDSRTTDLNEKRLLNIVEEMAIASGTPVPAVYILDDEPGLNAFAAGLTTSDAVVAVTRGTLEKLNRDELQGVVAHEFSHILNGDMRLNMRLSALLFGILVLGLLGRILLSSLRHTRVAPRSRNEKNSGGVLAFIVVAGLALMIVGYVGYFFGRLIQAAVSRQREFLADASAVQFTRNPAGIVGALKKIGGYALGSSLQSAKSAEIGHFFFAQGFRSMFGGLWATHPPLDERIRAIDTHFDGKFFEPPQVVDVALESFITAGFAGPKVSGSIREALAPAAAIAAVEAIGTLTPDQIANAHVLLEAVPQRLRDAAHDPTETPVLLYTLLLAHDLADREPQQRIVTDRAGADAALLLAQLEPSLAELRPEHRLPLLQLALPALRQLAPGALEAFIDTLDELVHADAHVSTFEFALQKLLVRTLLLGRKPEDAIVQYHSFNAVGDEISIVLSALAHAATSDAAFAPQAYAAGAAHLKQVDTRLQFLAKAASNFAQLDKALDKLARASLPIKQRTLLAAAKVVSADGRILITEAELLRAIAASLDCPMPPLG
ncbi:MAG: M48 family metallopeptidase [Verrucomicrobiota bacterium]